MLNNEILHKINILKKLGDSITQWAEEWDDIALKAYQYNSWFTQENVKKSLMNISAKFLNENDLKHWLGNYPKINNLKHDHVLAIIAAGNIPLSVFHDFLSGFLAGWTLNIKLSEKDNVLLPFIIQKINEIDDAYASKFEIVERIIDYDAIIATGSNNSARYFNFYFSKKPNIIRKNKNSVAILTGDESYEELKALTNDIFDYFGLGCRNITKLYLPHKYDFTLLETALRENTIVIQSHKYMNNYDYNRAIYIINNIANLDFGSIILLNNSEFSTRIATLHYEFYDIIENAISDCTHNGDKIQCVVASDKVNFVEKVKFGETQLPTLWNYADGIDTLEFLVENA